MGSIASTGDKNVYLDAPGGSILDASEESAASTLSSAQVEQAWQALHLTYTYGASANIQNAINAFVQSVESDYAQYWQLLDVGTVAGDVLTLTPAGLTAYAPQAAAALNLGDTSPTPAQVQAYANGGYQGLVATFNQDLAEGWLDTPDFQRYNPNYTFTPSPAQHRLLQPGRGLDPGRATLRDQRLGALSSGTAIPVGNSTPNVTGGVVTLQSGSNIGRLDASVSITRRELNNGDLDDEQKAALLLASSPGDVTVVARVNGGTRRILTLGALEALGDLSGVVIQQVDVTATAPLFVSAAERARRPGRRRGVYPGDRPDPAGR